MLAWVLLSVTGVCLANTIPKDEVLMLSYEDPYLPDGAKMEVRISKEQRVITYHMEEQGNMGDVDTLEDYEVGLAASRVEDQDACFVRKITMTLEEATEQARKLSASGEQQQRGSEDVLAVPADEVEGWLGARLTAHCGDYPVYKLVKTEEDVQAEGRSDTSVAVVEGRDARQTSVAFTRCFLFFFIFKCITTTITIPTNTTIIFFLFG